MKIEPYDNAMIIKNKMARYPMPWRAVGETSLVDNNGSPVGQFEKPWHMALVARLSQQLPDIFEDYERLHFLEESRQGHDARQELPEYEEVVLIKDRDADIYGLGRVIAKIEGKDGIKAKWEVIVMGKQKVLEPGAWWRLGEYEKV